MNNEIDDFYSIAPMMGKTDSFFCHLMSFINQNTKIYTEMMHVETIIRTNILEKYKILKNLSNIVIQIAGNSPESFARAAKKASMHGFNEININCGCPSKNVIAGDFGLSLLKKPQLVRECIESIKNEVESTVSVKTRIGINYNNCENLLDDFVNEINLSGVNKFIIHARNGILNNMNTKKNLTIPPLKYERVFDLKKKFTNNHIIINGGFIKTEEIIKYIKKIDGIMIGREAYRNPWIFHKKRLLNIKEKIKIIEKYILSLKYYFNKNTFNKNSLIHIQKLLNGHTGAKSWRQKVGLVHHNKDLQLLLNYIKYYY